MQQQSHREADFKRGTKDGTEKRLDQSHRQNKRERRDLMAARRELRREAVMPPQGGIPPPGGVPTHVDVSSLVTRGDRTQAAALNAILKATLAPHRARSGTREQWQLYMDAFDAMFERHIKGADGGMAVIGALVRLYWECKDAAALSALVDLAGFATPTYDLYVCHAIVKGGFFQRVQGAQQIDMGIWDVANNVALSCPEGRDAVLQSPLFGFFVSEADAQQAPFMRTLRASARASDLNLQTLINAMLNHATPPAWSFVAAVWSTLVRALCELQPMPHDQLTGVDQVVRTRVLTNVLRVLLAKYKSIDTVLALPMPTGTGTAPAIAIVYDRLTALEPALSDDHRMNVCLPIFNHLAAVRPDCASPAALRLMVRGISAPKARHRVQAYLWMASYMSAGVRFVAEMLRVGAIRIMLHAVRTGEQHNKDARCAAVHALMGAFEGCFQDPNRAEADQMMRNLVVGCDIFNVVGPFLREQRSDLDKQALEMTCKVLQVAADALTWNREAAIAKLRESEVGDCIDTILTNIKGTADNELYDMAAFVDKLMGNEDDEYMQLADMKPGEYSF